MTAPHWCYTNKWLLEIKKKTVPSGDKMKFKLFCVTITNSWDVSEKCCGLKGTHAYKHSIQIRNKIRSYEEIQPSS